MIDNFIKEHIIHFHEDDRGQRLLNVFPKLSSGQINVTYVNSTKHIVAWHRHFKQIDYWCCLKGSFKVGLCDGHDVEWRYLSDKQFKILEIGPTIWHGYQALESNSIMLYGLTEKFSLEDEEKCYPGAFGETWEVKNR